jgi:hypothetical protein
VIRIVDDFLILHWICDTIRCVRFTLISNAYFIYLQGTRLSTKPSEEVLSMKHASRDEETDG